MGRPKAPSNDFTPSTLPPDHRLVMIGIPRGSGNFECVDPTGDERLVEVGTKLKKMVLIQRGDFGIIKLFPPSPESKSGAAMRQSKLSGEIVSMLNPKEVKEWKRSDIWPEGFGDLSKYTPNSGAGAAVSVPTQASKKGEIGDDDLPPQPEKEDEGYESDEELPP